MAQPSPPPGMVLVTVLVPPGVGPGGQLQLESPYGGRFGVTVPPGVSAGQMMHVHVPAPTGGQQMAPPPQNLPQEATEEDVSQLAAIFPNMDREVVQLILETCTGSSTESRMEEAISALLDMCGEGDGGATPPQTPPQEKTGRPV